jgi:uncharacterized protein YrrD
MVSEKTLKIVCCEVGSVGMFADLVNGSVQRTCSLQTLHQTYDRGFVDGVVERLS